MIATALKLAVPHGFTILDADLDHRGRLGVVWAGERGTEVSRNGLNVPMVGHAQRVDAVRWVGDDLLVWPLGGGTGLLKGGAIEPGIACAPRDILVSDQYIFATYGEQQFLMGTDDNDPAGDRLTIFDKHRARLFGVQELLGTSRDDPEFSEFTAGTVAMDGRLVFVADASPLLWILDAERKRLRTVRLERPIAVADDVAALVCGENRVGLISSGPTRLSVGWFHLGDGRLLGDQVLVLPGPGARWRVRGVGGPFAIAWSGNTLLKLSEEPD